MARPAEPAALGLDHVGLGIRDLLRASAAFERMGFRLSPLSLHAGALSPGGPVVPWGSGNRCAMFRQGYFELLGLLDPALPSNVKAMVERYEGLHIVALDCASADQAHAAYVQAGVAANAPISLERDATFGARDEHTRRARFRNVYFDPAAHPEARFIVIEHGTREVLWQPHLLAHPNGAEALAAVYLAVADVHASAARMARLLGRAPTPAFGGRGRRFALRQGTLWLADEATLRGLCPVLAKGPIQRVAAATIAVQSLPVLAAYLEKQGVPFAEGTTPDDGARSIWVGPVEAQHAALEFVQTSQQRSAT